MPKKIKIPEAKNLPPGRPSKYDPKFPDMLITHMREGNSFETFGALAHVSKQTLYDWLDAHPEFDEAYSIGQVLSEHWWWRKGMDHLVTYDKDVKFNAAVWIFTMKCRFKFRDGSENERNKDDDNKKPPSDEKIREVLDLVEARKKRGA